MRVGDLDVSRVKDWTSDALTAENFDKLTIAAVGENLLWAGRIQAACFRAGGVRRGMTLLYL